MRNILTDPRLFPTLIMVLNLGSAIMSLYAGDIKRFVYWTAALALTCSVTWME